MILKIFSIFGKKYFDVRFLDKFRDLKFKEKTWVSTPRALPKSATLLKTFLRCAPPTPPKNLFFLYPGQKFFGLNFWGVWGEHISVYQNFKNYQLFRGVALFGSWRGLSVTV